MLSRRERKRQEKIQKLANEGKNPEQVNNQPDESYRKRNRREDIKKTAPLVLLDILSFFVLYAVLSSSRTISITWMFSKGLSSL